LTLRPAQQPGSPPAIDIPAGHRHFAGHWVAEGLMLTNLPFEAEHVEALGCEGVDLVLNMCEDLEYWDGQREPVEAAYAATGIEEDRACQVQDLGEHPLELLDTATRLIDEANASGRNVAVHCRGGIERSAAVVAAVLIRRQGLAVDAALRHLRTIAPQASPLAHQRTALERWAASR